MKKLTENQGQELLRLARAAIDSHLGNAFDFHEVIGRDFDEKRGTFVTLKKDGELRGCIGNIESIRTIADGIRDNAVSAAFKDHRFSPLTVEELGNIQISISILTEAEQLHYVDASDLCAKLRPEIDGVILRCGRASSTFLPQVWEQLPDPEQFLSHLSAKAGLSQNSWREEGTVIEIYQVQNFSEGQL